MSKPVKVTIVLEVNDNDSPEDVVDSVEDVITDYLDDWYVEDIYAEEPE